MKKLLCGAALASAATISLAACGGSAADPVATQAKSSIAKELTAEATTATDPFKDATKASCVANSVVDKIGTKALIGYGLIDAQGNATKTKLDSAKASKADATSVVDSLFNCVGPQLMTQFQTSMAARETTTPAATKACLTALFSEETVRTIMIAQMQGSSSTDAQASMAAIETKAAACAKAK